MSNRKIHINEGQYRLLFERSGVSDEIVKLAESIRSEVLSLLNSNKYPSIARWKELGISLGAEQMYPDGATPNPDVVSYFKRYCLPLPINSIKNVDYINGIVFNAFGYNMREVSELDAYDFLTSCMRSKGNVVGYHDPNDSTITLTLPCGIDPADGSVHFGYKSLSILNHEIKHAFQYHKSGKAKNDNIYALSIEHDKSDKCVLNSLGISVYNLKYIYYVFDFGEIDAHLQEIYAYIANGGGDLSSCPAYRNITWAKEKFRAIYEYYTNGRYGYAIRGLFYRIYGSDVLDKYIKHCQKGIKRFDEHLRRIVGRIHDEYPNQKLFA